MNLLYKKITLTGAVLAFTAASFFILANGRPGDFFVDDTLYNKEIASAAAKHNIPAQLVRAVVFQESRFNPTARGRKGEYGLMQILPSGAVADWSKFHKLPPPPPDRLLDPELNLEIGCWYLSRALHRCQEYSDNIELALAQYNAGGTRANRWKPETKEGKVLPRITLPGTKKYVSQITKRYRNYLK